MKDLLGERPPASSRPEHYAAPRDIGTWLVAVQIDPLAPDETRENVHLLVPYPFSQHDAALVRVSRQNGIYADNAVPARVVAFRGTADDLADIVARRTDPGDLVADAFAALYDARGLAAPALDPDPPP